VKHFKNILYASGFWAIAIFLIFISVDKILMPILAGQFTARVIVPDVIDLPLKKAELLIQQSHLGVRWAQEGKYSSQIPKGHVMVQMPVTGREVKSGRNVFLTVSKGMREVKIPKLRGKSKRQAEISLNRLGLFQGDIIQGGHASIPKGVIIRTLPEAGKLIRIGDTLQLVISSGVKSGKILLPYLKGLSLNQAKATLDSLGFIIGQVNKLPSEKELPETILESYPRSGEYLQEGDTISLAVTD
jgi:serine/threonine-protein kinase